MGKIKTLSLQTVDVNIAGYADVLYNQIKGTTPVAPIIPALVFGGGNRLAQSEASSGNLVVYPNPVNDYLEIKTDNQGKLSCRILDMSGKLVSETKLNETERTINTSRLTAGIYFLEIVTEGNIKEIVRLTKQ